MDVDQLMWYAALSKHSAAGSHCLCGDGVGSHGLPNMDLYSKTCLHSPALLGVGLNYIYRFLFDFVVVVCQA
jgi:hypothetical protein